jgi:fatty-acyl-CoA synthase
VGKIFKPALRWKAIQKVYQVELEALGDLAESVEVAVSEDKVYGSLAAITIKAAPQATEDQIKDKVNEILARYTVKYNVEVI